MREPDRGGPTERTLPAISGREPPNPQRLHPRCGQARRTPVPHPSAVCCGTPPCGSVGNAPAALPRRFVAGPALTSRVAAVGVVLLPGLERPTLLRVGVLLNAIQPGTVLVWPELSTSARLHGSRRC